MTICKHKQHPAYCGACYIEMQDMIRSMGMNSYSLLVGEWKTHGHGQRLGQYFCNVYLKDVHAIPDLFNIDDGRAGEMIRTWLVDNQYLDALPEKRGRSAYLVTREQLFVCPQMGANVTGVKVE